MAGFNDTDLKRCSGCRESKSRDNFYKDRSNSDLLQRYCKDCSRVRRNKYSRKIMYGITPEEYTDLMARQCGLCAICQCWLADLRTGQVHLDHCHNTGKIRGILCNLCNGMLGYAKDDPKRLRVAANYLEGV